MLYVTAALFGALVVLTIYDLVQRRHAVLRNYPVIGHLRFWLEAIGPELRQYIVTDNNAERPFSRDQRRWVYASAKHENAYFAFGTDKDVEASESHVIIRPATFPHPAPPSVPGRDPNALPAAKILGEPLGRRHALRPPSVVNASAMSFGSLSGPAIEAINRGSAISGSWHNTGEGGISRHHLHGGDLVLQIGTGYFGCRDTQGRFDITRLVDLVAAHPVRAIEVKLSQGAKPGLGGVLPGAKVTAEIARMRGIPEGITCISPPAHTAFGDTDSMLDFVELLAQATGLPVGIKAAVGGPDFWVELATLMSTRTRGVDFITVDGGEGGTGAAPLSFADHVAVPFKLGFARVYRAFAEADLTDRVTFIGSGKLGLPDTALVAMAMGCDLVNVGREAMLAIGCIQAQRCHTDACPVGVATQNPRLTRGLHPDLKSVRYANYVDALRHDLLALARTAGHPHPAGVTLADIEVLDGRFGSRSGTDTFGYQPGWGRPSSADLAAAYALMEH